DGQVPDTTLDIDPVALRAPTAAVVDDVAFDGHIAVRGVARPGLAVHDPATADIHGLSIRIVHYVVTDDDIVAGRSVIGTPLVRAVRRGHQIDARTIGSRRGVLALAILHNPVVAANGDFLVPARGNHVQAMKGDVAMFGVRR